MVRPKQSESSPPKSCDHTVSNPPLVATGDRLSVRIRFLTSKHKGSLTDAVVRQRYIEPSPQSQPSLSFARVKGEGVYGPPSPAPHSFSLSLSLSSSAQPGESTDIGPPCVVAHWEFRDDCFSRDETGSLTGLPRKWPLNSEPEVATLFGPGVHEGPLY